MPFDRLQVARERIEAVRQARVLLDMGEPPPVWGAQDVGAALELGEKGVMLEGPALRAIAETMRTGSAIRKHLLNHEANAPILYGLGASLVDLSRTAGEVGRCFDPDGQLADHASRDLGPLRQRVRSLREGIQNKLAELVTSTELQPLLQENYYTIRADRYVLPIKASFKNEVRGIVHDASGSGQTVYIEPQALVDLGNRLKIAQSEQLEEEHRILSRLTKLVSREAEPVRAMMRVIGLCDLLMASARLASDLGAIPVVPDESPGFSLVRARHPLLVLQSLAPPPVVEGEPLPPVSALGERRPLFTVVANDLGLERGQLVLVLTGPNTGGKTVAMKTIGLFALMARAGLHLPCGEGSRIGWYDQIEVAIGDQQSIAQHLSTFAAHMKELVEVIQRANARTLVLVDEIAADTDPTQGQSLAQSILERLADRGAHVVVTTHFERLKAVPFVDPRFRNAGVGFDARRLRPTYHVTLDVPQGSSGFDIAQSLGLPEDIVERARDLTGAGTLELETLIKQVESRSSALEQARIETEQATRAAEAEVERLRKKEEALEREIVEVRNRAREELLEEVSRARNQVRQLIASLQSAAEKQPVRDTMRAATAAAEQLAKVEEEEAAKLAPQPAPKGRLEEPKAGDWVHVARLGRDGEVIGVEGRDALVSVGNIRMRVPLASLLPPAGPRPKTTGKPARERRPSEARVEEAEQKIILEDLDVRGFTVDEAISRLEAFLDYHYGTPTTHVRIVHGHGTGALRDALREHLRRSGYVKSIRPGEAREGGDGVTVVALS